MDFQKLIEKYKGELVELLRTLVSFPSVKDEKAFAAAQAGAETTKPFGDGVDGAYRHMLAQAEADGFDVFDADGWGGHIEWAGAILNERGEPVDAATETLGIPIHLDVVPPGNGWDTDPWTLTEKDGQLVGRGTSDDKGAAAAVYIAFKALKDSGYIPSKNIRLILGLDEETGWSGMERYLSAVAPPDFGFSPDADFPVIQGEKWMLGFEIAKKLEPSREQGLHLRGMEGGTAPNMVADFCKAVLIYDDGKPKDSKKKNAAQSAKSKAAEKEAFESVKTAAAEFSKKTGYSVSYKGRGKSIELTARGLASHGSHPEEGLNAISILMQFLAELPIVNESARDFVDFYVRYIGFETDGKSLGIASSDKQSGELTVNIGQISLSKEAAILRVDVRNPVSRTEEEVYDGLRPLLDKRGLGVLKIAGVAPLWFDEDTPLVKTLMDVYKEHTGDRDAKPLVMGGGTYARAIPNAVAFGPRFPGEPNVMHTANEYISEESLLRAAAIYADAIYRLTKS